MDNPTLLVGIGLAILDGFIYAYIGWRLSRRRVDPEVQIASRAFTAWWMGLSLTTLVTAANVGIVWAHAGSLELFWTLTIFNVAIVCVALWGLLYHLIFLATGWRSAIWWVTLFYLVYFPYLLYVLVSAGPTSIEIHRWSAVVLYERPLEGAVFQVVLLLLVGPQLLAALAYFAIGLRLRDRTRRYRTTLISWSLLLWFGSALAAAGTGLGQRDDWQIASRLIGLGAALIILAAYHPPGWVRRRFHVQTLEEADRTQTGVVPNAS